MNPFTFFRPNLLNPPGLMKPWQGGDGQTFREVIAGELDATIIAAEQVADARNVLKCDPSILPYHAQDRMMPRFSTVDESVWRIMLSKFRQIHATAGHPWCLLRLLRIFLRRFGRPMLRYVSTAGDGSFSQWHTLAPGDGLNDYFELGRIDPEFSTHTETPANWLWDANASAGHWSRFWIFIYTSGLDGMIVQSEYDDAVSEWDSGVDYWDGYIDATEIAEMVTMINTFKASNSQLNGLILVHDNAIFDPTGSGAGFPGGDWDSILNRIHDDVTYSYEHA